MHRRRFLISPSMSHVVHRFRDDLTTAIKAAFTKHEGSEPLDARTHFHEQFRQEADEYDRDFHKKYHDDLNTILIFVRCDYQVANLTNKQAGRSLFHRGDSLHYRHANGNAPRLQ